MPINSLPDIPGFDLDSEFPDKAIATGLLVVKRYLANQNGNN